MIKKILLNLFACFFFSVLLTGLLYAIWFSSAKKGFEEGLAMTIILAVGNVFQNIMLFIVALPALLLSKEKIYTNVQARLVYYFIGPALLTLFLCLVVANNVEDSMIFFLAGFSFIAIHAYFYYRLTVVKKDGN